MNFQRPGVQVAAQPAVSTYLMAEEIKRFPVIPSRTKVQCNCRPSLAGLSEPQTSWADLTHGDYQMTKHPLLRSFAGERQNLNSSVGPLAAATHPLQKGHSECSHSRNMMSEDSRSSLLLPPYVTGIGKHTQSQTLMEFHKAEVGLTRKLCKKDILVPQEQVEETRQPQEPKVLVHAEKSFLECLTKIHIPHRKNQEKPRKGCAQECGETEKRKHLTSAPAKQTADLQSQDKKIQANLQQPLRTATRQRAPPEKSVSEQDVLTMVCTEATRPKSVQNKMGAWQLFTRDAESKIYPAVNRENQQLWRKLQQLAQDYYRVEETRKQLLKQKQELKYQQWDSVIRGTSITLAEREHKQRCPKEPDMVKAPVSGPLCPMIGINLN